jgi:hypothetical protein
MWHSLPSETHKPMLRPITYSHTILAVYTEDPRSGTDATALIIFGAWPDGRVVWSRDRLQGGPPYFAGSIDPQSITSLLRRFHKNGMFTNANLARSRTAEDAPYTTVLIRFGTWQLQMQSCHEFFEAQGVTVTSAGPSPASDRPSIQVWAEEPVEYLHFRVIWSETRRDLDGLIPAEGEETAGRPVRQGGELFWQEP